MTDNINTTTENLSPEPSSNQNIVNAAPEAAAVEHVENNVHAPLFGHRFGTIDGAALGISAACIIASQFVGAAVPRWILVGVSILALFSPAIIQKEMIRRQFGLGSIFRRFKKMGLDPRIDGDEITWEFQGKRNSIRIHNGCQLQVYREYPAPQDVMPAFETAATATMDEVFSAKVGVHREEGAPENIFFSTELLCSSMKEFDKILPASVCILDAAEERQRENIKEVRDSRQQKARKIGFTY